MATNINNIAAVNIKEATIIKPSNPTPSHVLPLSPLDSQLFLRFTIEYLFVYDTSSNDAVQRSLFTQNLKLALSNILVPYYPLAGRVRFSHVSSNRLEVNCQSQGVLFLEAYSDSDFGSFQLPKSVSQWRKLLSFHVADVLKGAPPLVVQLTWLRSGGATLAFGFNHCLLDGVGSSDFLNSFAHLATSGGLVELNPNPVWDRHLLEFDPVGSNSIVYHPEFSRVPDLCSGGFMSSFSNEKVLTPTSVIFDRRSQDELKRVATTTFFTSFEVLAAHVWRSWARSMDFPRNQTLKLLFSVNIRDRVNPNLPAGYYGNAFVLGCAEMNAEEITEKGLGHVAMLVKKAKERVDDEFVRSTVESVSSGKVPDSVGVLILSQWSRLGLERVDFGLGKPVSVGPVCVDRYCLMLPVHGQVDGVKVTLAVPASGARKYEYLVKSPCSSS
ncbi:Alcohol acyltransferase 9 [Linum grandiflorum]